MVPSASVLRPLSVLVVDDLADAAESLASVLALCGFLARTAATAAAALVLAAADPPDAAVFELRLPDLDGCELARRLAGPALGRRPLLGAGAGGGAGAGRRRARGGGARPPPPKTPPPAPP